MKGGILVVLSYLTVITHAGILRGSFVVGVYVTYTTEGKF